MKKWSIFAIMLILIPTLTAAQSRVSAEDFLQQINDGKTVHFTNTVIEGNLDLTTLKDWTPDKNNREINCWNNTRTF
jgi:cell division protein YceG involved in septum cleavage